MLKCVEIETMCLIFGLFKSHFESVCYFVLKMTQEYANYCLC